jgi:hypothetical protein
MRLVAWNIRQGGGSRLPRIAAALKRQDADILALSEYRGGPSAPRLCGALHALGYRHATTLVPPPSRNGVLIAARCPFRQHGAVDMGLPEPYRMISVDFATFRLSGVYMPNLLAKVPYWEALIAALSLRRARPMRWQLATSTPVAQISTRRGRSTRQPITWMRSSRSGSATCGGAAIPMAANIPGSAPRATGSASTMPFCHRIWPLAPAPSAIPTRSGSPGSPITRR